MPSFTKRERRENLAIAATATQTLARWAAYLAGVARLHVVLAAHDRDATIMVLRLAMRPRIAADIGGRA